MNNNISNKPLSGILGLKIDADTYLLPSGVKSVNLCNRGFVWSQPFNRIVQVNTEEGIRPLRGRKLTSFQESQEFESAGLIQCILGSKYDH